MEDKQKNKGVKKLCFFCEKNKVDTSLNHEYGICQPCDQEFLDLQKEVLQNKIKENRLNPSISEIIPGKLYLGNEDTAVSLNILKEKGITHILVVGREQEQHFKDLFKYHQVFITDSTVQQMSQYINECYEFIEQGNNVFVHCQQGISRSSSMVIAYIMKNKNISYFEARDYVKQRREEIRPNGGFAQQLIIFQEDELKIKS